MDFSGLGGIAILIIAGIVLFLFVPGWASGQNPEKRMPEVVTKKNEITNQNSRLTRTRRLASSISLVSFAASVFTSFLAQANPLIWFALVALVPIFFTTAALAIAAMKAGDKLSAKPVRQANRRLSFENQLKTEVKPVSAINERAWIPTRLPDPLSNRVGELRQVAPVVSFETAKADAELENQKPEIDVLEILKRRRAN